MVTLLKKKNVIFSILLPITTSRRGLSDDYFLKGPTSSIITSESVLCLDNVTVFFLFLYFIKTHKANVITSPSLTAQVYKVIEAFGLYPYELLLLQLTI